MKVVIGILVLLVVLGGAWFFFFQGTPADQEAKEMAPSYASQEESEGSALPSVVTSIREAMGRGAQMQCTYAVEDGERSLTSKVYVEGGKYKTVAEVDSVKMEAVFDGKTQYMWMSGSTQGMKLDEACLEEMKGKLPQGGEPQGSSARLEDYQKTFDMAKNVQCEPVAGIDFSLPANVTFSDQCALLRESQEMMKTIPGMNPAALYPKE